jgi:hypothetical protein
MMRFIEKSFFGVVQKVGILFALISFALIVFLGMFSYEKINSRATDEISAPVIDLAKYQNPISVQMKVEQSIQPSGIVQENAQIIFDQAFNAQIEQIIANLQALPNQVIGQNDAQFQIKVMIKIKSNIYSPALRLSYVKSLSRLTKQLVNVGGDQVNVDEFLHWHDQEFARQVDQQTQQNLMKMGTAKSDQMTGLISFSMMGVALGFFIMFVMMLAMLRIERNTRK